MTYVGTCRSFSPQNDNDDVTAPDDDVTAPDGTTEVSDDVIVLPKVKERVVVRGNDGDPGGWLTAGRFISTTAEAASSRNAE